MATAPPHVGVLRARLSAAGPWWLSWMGLLLLALLYSHGMTTEGASAHPVHPGLTALSAAAHSAAGHGGGSSAGSSAVASTAPSPGLSPDSATGSGSGSASGAAPGSVAGAAPSAGRGLAAGPPATGRGVAPAPYNSHDVSHATQDCLSGAVRDMTGLGALCVVPGVGGPFSYGPGWGVVRVAGGGGGVPSSVLSPVLRI
ncbi:hypothetical protein AF335_11565 [Streptomyces eurocidicus]|uniref:Uncharacterized protein n=1 Tax=Streptomyces eurocidicus TaxID=66423 RepID=A0A2N8NXL0_STREU|nr:hypothetical protein AF335_11565 [Streptomyces eurocidicus]